MNIYTYILRRLLYIFPVIIGVSFLIFILFNVVCPDPTLIMLGKHATPEQMAMLRTELGLDRPLWVQYFDILKSAFTFDFGRSWNTKQEIFQMIKNGAIPSLTFTVPGFIFSTITSLSIAVVVAFYRGKFLDKFFVVICVSMMSISSLAYILFFQWFFAYKLGMFEISGYEDGFPYFIPYVILPIIIWIILSLGYDLRFYRTVMLDEIYQDYVRTARAKGLSERVILFKHVLKNAMIPVITYVVIQIPYLILGALLIENFFGIPGLGSLVVDAINSNDFGVLKAMSILTSLAFIFFNLLSDVLYTMVDPRVRLK
jgi:peptide/nickel transport system permease protein